MIPLGSDEDPAFATESGICVSLSSTDRLLGRSFPTRRSRPFSFLSPRLLSIDILLCLQARHQHGGEFGQDAILEAVSGSPPLPISRGTFSLSKWVNYFGGQNRPLDSPLRIKAMWTSHSPFPLPLRLGCLLPSFSCAYNHGCQPSTVSATRPRPFRRRRTDAGQRVKEICSFFSSPFSLN